MAASGPIPRTNQVARATAIVDIMDENGSMTLPVGGASNLTENYVGTRLGALETMLGGRHSPPNWCLCWASLFAVVILVSWIA